MHNPLTSKHIKSIIKSGTVLATNHMASKNHKSNNRNIEDWRTAHTFSDMWDTCTLGMRKVVATNKAVNALFADLPGQGPTKVKRADAVQSNEELRKEEFLLELSPATQKCIAKYTEKDAK